MVADLAGPPFHFAPEYSLRLTIPQFIYCWLRAGDMLAEHRLEEFHLRMYAIGAVMSKNNRRIVKQVTAALTREQISEGQFYEDLDEQDRVIMFGSRRKRS